MISVYTADFFSLQYTCRCESFRKMPDGTKILESAITLYRQNRKVTNFRRHTQSHITRQINISCRGILHRIYLDFVSQNAHTYTHFTERKGLISIENLYINNIETQFLNKRLKVNSRNDKHVCIQRNIRNPYAKKKKRSRGGSAVAATRT